MGWGLLQVGGTATRHLQVPERARLGPSARWAARGQARGRGGPATTYKFRAEQNGGAPGRHGPPAARPTPPPRPHTLPHPQEAAAKGGELGGDAAPQLPRRVQSHVLAAVGPSDRDVGTPLLELHRPHFPVKVELRREAAPHSEDREARWRHQGAGRQGPSILAMPAGGCDCRLLGRQRDTSLGSTEEHPMCRAGCHPRLQAPPPHLRQKVASTSSAGSKSSSCCRPRPSAGKAAFRSCSRGGRTMQGPV